MKVNSNAGQNARMSQRTGEQLKLFRAYAREHTMGLRPPVVDAVRDYTGSGYRPVNDLLRRGTTLADAAAATRTIGLLDEAVANSSLPQNTRLYRFTSSQRVRDDVAAAVGSTLTDPGFVSTSASHAWALANLRNSETAARSFLTHGHHEGKLSDAPRPQLTVIAIDAAKGTPAIVVGDRLSNTPAEAEVILPRGTTLAIRGVRDTGGVRFVRASIAPTPQPAPVR